MAIGSQVFAATKDSPAARKRISPSEFLLTLFVVMAATMVGVAGGLWLAERDQSTGRQEAVSPHASAVRLSSQPLSKASEGRKADLPIAKVSKAAAKRSEGEITSLGLPSVRRIYHSRRQDYTEIAIELRAAVLLRAAQLHNPERVYFDFAERGQAQKPKGRLKSRREVSLRDDRVAGVRVVRWESGSVRLVVDLKHPCEYSYRLSSEPPSRLILGLWTHPPGSLASQKPQQQGSTGISEAFGAERP